MPALLEVDSPERVETLAAPRVMIFSLRTISEPFDEPAVGAPEATEPANRTIDLTAARAAQPARALQPAETASTPAAPTGTIDLVAPLEALLARAEGHEDAVLRRHASVVKRRVLAELTAPAAVPVAPVERHLDLNEVMAAVVEALREDRDLPVRLATADEALPVADHEGLLEAGLLAALEELAAGATAVDAQVLGSPSESDDLLAAGPRATLTVEIDGGTPGIDAASRAVAAIHATEPSGRTRPVSMSVSGGSLQLRSAGVHVLVEDGRTLLHAQWPLDLG